MERFCKQLPKVELHAHLNGSLSTDTIVKLKNYHIKTWPEEKLFEGTDVIIEQSRQGNLDEPFRLFPLIHSLTDNLWAVSEATKDVIRDFAEDGVIYLELRTTPRRVEGRMEKEDYCRTVAKEIINSRQTCPGILVKLILAVDRRHPDCLLEHAQLYFKLKEEFPDVLVGLDISGDPRVGDITPLIPDLKQLRDQGLRLTVHLAEVVNHKETLEFLKFGPDRIGHGTCIHPDLGGTEDLWRRLIETQIPVEACMSSNLVGGSVPSHEGNHVGLYDGKVPVVLCTDDKGIFSCTLSDEFVIGAETFGWNREKLYKVARDAVNYTFATDQEKEDLFKAFDSWKEANKQLFP